MKRTFFILYFCLVAVSLMAQRLYTTSSVRGRSPGVGYGSYLNGGVYTISGATPATAASCWSYVPNTSVSYTYSSGSSYSSTITNVGAVSPTMRRSTMITGQTASVKRRSNDRRTGMVLNYNGTVKQMVARRAPNSGSFTDDTDNYDPDNPAWDGWLRDDNDDYDPDNPHWGNAPWDDNDNYDPDNPQFGPITDGVWVLVILVVLYAVIRRRRKTVKSLT